MSITSSKYHYLGTTETHNVYKYRVIGSDEILYKGSVMIEGKRYNGQMKTTEALAKMSLDKVLKQVAS